MPTRRGPLGILFSVLAVGVTLATMAYGVVSLVNVLAVRTYRTTTSFPLTDTLVLKGGNSRITLVADATDAIVVEASVRRGIIDPPALASVRGDELVLDGSCAQVLTSFCSVELTVHVPEHLNLRGGVDDGSLQASGLIGSVDVSIGDGWADLTDFDADTVDLSTADGQHRRSAWSTRPGRSACALPTVPSLAAYPVASPTYSVTASSGDGSRRGRGYRRPEVESPDGAVDG